MNDEELIFNAARTLYPGQRRGNEPEFANFCKKYKRWREFLPLLEPAIREQIRKRDALAKAGEFVPNWQNFKTWINNYGWTTEYPDPPKSKATQRVLSCLVCGDIATRYINYRVSLCEAHGAMYDAAPRPVNYQGLRVPKGAQSNQLIEDMILKQKAKR